MDPHHSDITFLEPIFQNKIGTQTRVFEEKEKRKLQKKRLR